MSPRCRATSGNAEFRADPAHARDGGSHQTWRMGTRLVTTSAPARRKARVEHEDAGRNGRAVRADGGTLREQALVDDRRRARHVEPVDVDGEHAGDGMTQPRRSPSGTPAARTRAPRTRTQSAAPPRRSTARQSASYAGSTATFSASRNVCVRPRARAPARAGRRACGSRRRGRRAGRRPRTPQ